MYKAIMVPIDLSQTEKGKATIEVARKLGDKGARIVLVNVVVDIPTYLAAELPGGVIEKAKENAHSDLEDMAKAAGVKADVDVRSGTPATAILAAAEEKGVDLIVVASHRPGMQDYLLGSTASRVVRYANCSVLVVR